MIDILLPVIHPSLGRSRLLVDSSLVINYIGFDSAHSEDSGIATGPGEDWGSGSGLILTSLLSPTGPSPYLDYTNFNTSQYVREKIFMSSHEQTALYHLTKPRRERCRGHCT